MNNMGKDFEYTPEEIKAIENAMKKDEFRKLLADYMEEISDPKNKEEYDQYLQQLQNQQELPKGMKLINPTACFCIKTKIKNKKNPAFNQKLFINICMSPELEKPSQDKDKSNRPNEKGQQWHIPYSAGKPRMDQDKHKSVCQTMDVVFHPLTFEYCRKTDAFKKMICEIAVETGTKQMKDPDETVSRDYKVLNRMKCKGEKPASMPVRLDAQYGDHEQNTRAPAPERNEDYAPKLYQEFVNQQNAHKETKAKEEAQKAQTNGRVVELASQDFETIEEKPGEQEGEATLTKKKIKAPQYKIVHSYGVEYSDFLIDGPKKGKKRPKQLVIKIEVPRVAKMSDMNLDINETNLILTAKEKYYLDITLPFKVNSDDGTAKFDKATKVLTVTLPTNQEDENEEHNNREDVNGAESNGIEEIEGNQENKELIQEIENTNETVEETGKNSFLNVVTEESQKKYKEGQESLAKNIATLGDEDKKLVEEIEPSNQDGQQQTNSKQSPKKEVNRNVEFLTQETFEDYFFMFHIQNYDKDAMKVGLLKDEIILHYQDETRDLMSHIKILKEFDGKASHCKFVKDYIVLNLKKTQGEFWESNGWKKEEYNNESAEKLKQHEEDQKREEQEQEQKRKQNESKSEEKSAPAEEEQSEKANEENEKEEVTEEKADLEGSENKNIEERFVEKRSINFINYNRTSFLFEID